MPKITNFILMKKKSNVIYGILTGIIFILLFKNVENREVSDAYRIEKEQAQKRLKVVRDSVVKVIQRKDEELLKAMRESAEADMVAKESVQQAEKYRKKYESVKRYSTKSDHERDSVLTNLLSH